MAPATASPPVGIHGGSDGLDCLSMLSMAVAPAVVTVNVLETGEPPDGATLDGANAHVSHSWVTIRRRISPCPSSLLPDLP